MTGRIDSLLKVLLTIWMLGWIALGPPARAQELLITEFVAVNRESALDETGDNPDWIEIHNPGSSPVDLSDVVRQDGEGFPDSWGGVAADDEMDPDVVEDPAYRDTIENDIITTIQKGHALIGRHKSLPGRWRGGPVPASWVLLNHFVLRQALVR